MEKIKLIRVYVEKKYLLTFRIIMICVALYFLSNIYVAFENGSVFYKGDTTFLGDGLFLIYVLRELMISALFIWMATGGAKVKE